MPLTLAGFEPYTFEEIQTRINAKLVAFDPNTDLDPSSPDGNLVSIMTFELAQAQSQLSLVHSSYNPMIATGASLKNLGLLTGKPYGMAQRSQVVLETQGTTGTIIPSNSIVTDNDGNEFYTAFAAVIPANIQAVARDAGNIPVPAGSVVTVQTNVTGWTGITQTTDGLSGSSAQTEQQFRNERQKTVMRNHVGIADTIKARLEEGNVRQAKVTNNDGPNTLPDGTPAGAIHVTVGEAPGVLDEEIAKIIFDSNAPGCPTFGSTTVPILDNQGYPHDVSFSRSVMVDVEIDLNVTFLDENTAGAVQNIEDSLIGAVNGLASGEDVIWSRLFAYVTAFSRAQINFLALGPLGGSLTFGNLAISETEFANIDASSITITVT